MSILDIIIFLFFTGGVVVFGCSFFNKKRSSEEFTSAGRSLPGWVVGMSIFATYVSSISYLAYPINKLHKAHYVLLNVIWLIRARPICPIGMLLYSACPFR